MKLAPVRVFLCKHPLSHFSRRDNVHLIYITTDEEINIFVTLNTESENFSVERYSEKYTILV